MEAEEFKSQCIVRLETSRWHSGTARQRACAKLNALRGSDNNHRAGSNEATSGCRDLSLTEEQDSPPSLATFSKLPLSFRLMKNLHFIITLIP
ncbi:hypothetical protein PAMP_013525 [Pampus punctatissimus]